MMNYVFGFKLERVGQIIYIVALSSYLTSRLYVIIIIIKFIKVPNITNLETLG